MNKREVTLVHSSLGLILIMCLVSSLCSCVKEEIRPGLPVFEALAGVWYFDSVYSVNGTQFFISQCDSETEFIFSDIRNSSENNSPCNTYTIGIGISIEKCTGMEVTTKYNPNCNKSFYHFFVSKESSSGVDSEDLILFLKEDSDFTGKEEDECDCNQLRTYDINSFGSSYFVHSFDKDRIELNGLVHWYGRVINGVEIPDTVEITLTKSRQSPSINVVNFNPKNEDLGRCLWGDFNGSLASYIKNGTGSILYRGILDEQENSTAYLNLDGNGGYIDEYELDITKWCGPNKTISIWIKPTEVSREEQIIIAKYKNDYGPFQLVLNYDYPKFGVNNGFGQMFWLYSDRKVLKDSWNNIVVVTNDSDYQIFINGNFAGQTILPSMNYSDNSEVWIGNSQNNVYNANDDQKSFKGGVDGIMVFDQIFGAGLVKQMYNWGILNTMKPDALADYYVDELTDDASYVISGQVKIVDYCVYENCLQFYGGYSNEMIFAEDSDEDEYAFSMWINPDDESLNQIIASSSEQSTVDCEDNDAYFNLEIVDGGIKYTRYTTNCENPTIEYLSGTRKLKSEWNHILLQYRKFPFPVREFYLNGELVIRSTSADEICHDNSLSWLGYSGHHESCGINYNRFKGFIDELYWYYDTWLSQEEILILLEWYKTYGKI